MCKDYNLKISTGRTKIMAFKGKHLVRSEIEIDGSILEQVKQFNYLGCELSLDGEPGFDQKINRFQGICGTIRKHLKKTHTDTQMKFYKVVARPSLLYGSETWVTTKRDMTCLEFQWLALELWAQLHLWWWVWWFQLCWLLGVLKPHHLYSKDTI